MKGNYVLAMVIVVLALAASAPAVPGVAQTETELWTQDQKLTASDGEQDANFGTSIVIDGDTALIGASGNSDGEMVQGAVYVFQRSSDGWVEEARLTPEGAAPFDSFGYRMALDGDTLVIGGIVANVDGNVNQGAAWVFTREGGTWTEVAKLVASDGASGDNFGGSVAIDGDTILVGASNSRPEGITGQGAVWVFKRTNGVWSETNKLVASDGAHGDGFGGAVALEGEVAVVGSPLADVDGNFIQGAIYIFDTTQWEETAKVLASDGGAFQGFGYSLSLDAGTLLVGNPHGIVAGNDQGTAHVLELVDDAWVETGRLTADDQGEDGWEFGTSVHLDGNFAAVGAPWTVVDGNNARGAAWFFTRKGGEWVRGAKLIADDGLSDDFLGGSVAVSPTTVMASAWLDDIGSNLGQGSVYVYEHRELSPPTPSINIAPSSVVAELPAGETGTEEITISNLGTGELDWSATITATACDAVAEVPWLGIQPESGTITESGSATVDMTFETEGLDPGTNGATVCIESNDAQNPIVEVPVSLTVTESGVTTTSGPTTSTTEVPSTTTQGPSATTVPEPPVTSTAPSTTVPEDPPADDDNDAVEFDDVSDGHLFSDEIDWLSSNGITIGCNPPVNSLFCPEDEVSRGQMAAFLVRALSLPDAEDQPFSDMDGDVFAEDAAALAAAGITRGCNPPDGTLFCPQDAVTRGQMAAFLVRALDLPSLGRTFDDTVGHLFEDEISALAAAGVTYGCNPPENSLFCPDDAVERGQMAAFLYRALGR